MDGMSGLEHEGFTLMGMVSERVGSAFDVKRLVKREVHPQGRQR